MIDIDKVALSIRECEEWGSFWDEKDSRVLANAAVRELMRQLLEMYTGDLVELGRRVHRDYTGEEVSPSGIAVSSRAMLKHIIVQTSAKEGEG